MCPFSRKLPKFRKWEKENNFIGIKCTQRTHRGHGSATSVAGLGDWALGAEDSDCWCMKTPKLTVRYILYYS